MRIRCLQNRLCKRDLFCRGRQSRSLLLHREKVTLYSKNKASDCGSVRIRICGSLWLQSGTKAKPVCQEGSGFCCPDPVLWKGAVSGEIPV